MAGSSAFVWQVATTTGQRNGRTISYQSYYSDSFWEGARQSATPAISLCQYAGWRGCCCEGEDCVTGGNGYIASVKMLLEKGYAVKTTVTNPGLHCFPDTPYVIQQLAWLSACDFLSVMY
jgi:hypothetical protein